MGKHTGGGGGGEGGVVDMDGKAEFEVTEESLMRQVDSSFLSSLFFSQHCLSFILTSAATSTILGGIYSPMKHRIVKAFGVLHFNQIVIDPPT